MKEPQLSVYPVFQSEEFEKAVVLCSAKGMFPDLVKFTWKAKDQNQHNVQLGGDEQLEQRHKTKDKGPDPEVRITSMLIIDKQKAENKTFTCSVQHDSSVKDKELSISNGNNNAMIFYYVSAECINCLDLNILIDKKDIYLEIMSTDRLD